MLRTFTGHVFISYSRKDDTAMQRIVTFLRGQGVKVWVDNEKLVPGTPIWEEEIENAIGGAFAIVVVLSPDSKKSEWVRREVTLADQFHKRMFPVLVAGNEDDSIPLRLITRQFVDIRTHESEGLHSLKMALSSYLEEIQKQAEHIETEFLDTNEAAHHGEIIQNNGMERKDASTPRVPSASANLNSIFWITLGWVIGGAVGGALYFGTDTFSDEIGQAIGGAVGWAIGGFVLWRALPRTATQKIDMIRVVLAWAVAGAIGWALGEAVTEASGAALGAAVGALIGMIVTSRIYPRFSNWQSIFWITLAWAVGGAIGWLIGKGIQESGGYLLGLEIGKIAGWSIGRAIGGLIGGSVMGWQINRRLNQQRSL